MRHLLIVIIAFLPCSSLEARETRAQKQEVTQHLRRFFVQAESLADCAKGTVKERQQVLTNLRADLTPLLQKVSGPRRDQITKSFETYGEAVMKGEPEGCLETLMRAKTDWKDAFRLVASPSQTPELALGRQIFVMHCAGCHGPTGRGDGPLASKGRPMVPAPTNFMAPSARLLSPYRTFNVLIMGREGTTMGSYEELLTTHEMWSLAFFIAAMPHLQPNAASTSSTPVDIDLEGLSYRSDAELLKTLPSRLSSEEHLRFLSRLRTKDGFDPELARKKMVN